MVVYSAVRLGVNPQINALATIIVAVVALAIGAAGWLVARRASINDAPLSERGAGAASPREVI
jgi:putrescine transport system permease protein